MFEVADRFTTSTTAAVSKDTGATGFFAAKSLSTNRDFYVFVLFKLSMMLFPI
jgi:hypothetical protein